MNCVCNYDRFDFYREFFWLFLSAFQNSRKQINNHDTYRSDLPMGWKGLENWPSLLKLSKFLFICLQAPNVFWYNFMMYVFKIFGLFLRPNVFCEKSGAPRSFGYIRDWTASGENNWIYICSIDFHKETEYYNTAYKVSVFGVILVCIFPHSDWIRRDTDQNNSEYGHFLRSVIYNQPNIYLFKFNNRNTRKRYEIYSKLIIKTLERRQWLLFVCWKVVQLKCFRIQLI